MRVIRVAQIIDSLSPGGAEMVAVNIANELAGMEGFVSYLIVSRKGGILEKRVHKNVPCIILHKKSSKDVVALWRLYKLLAKEKIDIVHAHSSSFYFPVIIKKFSHFKLVWHDHYGKNIDLVTGKREYPVKFFAKWFDYVFVVNKQLLETDIKFFKIQEDKICYLPNFSVAEAPVNNEPAIFLKGDKKSRIICLANLRAQKDHLNLLNAFKLVLLGRPDAHLYLVGGGKADEYEHRVTDFISANNLGEKVIWLGTQTYPTLLLRQCSVGVLSSESEGLPLAIIEYGLSGLAVVCTSVGEVPHMLSDKNEVLLVPAKNAGALAHGLLKVLDNNDYRLELAQNLSQLIEKKYSSAAIMDILVYHYKNIGIGND